MSDLSLDEKKTENSRLNPVKMSWITDFTLVCPDRDILVVRECLVLASGPLAAALEDKSSTSLSIPWKSPGIIEVMKTIHSFGGQLYAYKLIVKPDAVFQTESDMMEFCFRYDIEPLLTELKTQFIEKVCDGGSNAKWIEFFHRFKNPDGTEVFADQTNAMRWLPINNPVSINGYFNKKTTYHINDLIEDYEFIIRGLIMRLNKANEMVSRYSTDKTTITLEVVCNSLSKNASKASSTDSKLTDVHASSVIRAPVSTELQLDSITNP